jgi:hypothetical protein
MRVMLVRSKQKEEIICSVTDKGEKERHVINLLTSRYDVHDIVKEPYYFSLLIAMDPLNSTLCSAGA